MKLTQLGIEGAWVAESLLREDERGYFREWFKSSDLETDVGIKFSVAQANISKSNRNVIRGIHFSNSSVGQAKWITCSRGAVIDCVVDLRIDSPTFKVSKTVVLKENDGKGIFIVSGLGHGFLSLEDNSQVTYLLSSEYDPGNELGINPFDPDLKIDWRLDSTSSAILSDKDLDAPSLKELISQTLLPTIAK